MTDPVDAYLGALRPDQQAALQSLRSLLRRHLPDHIECLSYAMPGFRQPGPKGKMVAGFAAFAKNCGYYPHSGNIIRGFTPDLAAWKTTPRAILFTPDNPLPPKLVSRLVAARLQELTTQGDIPFAASAKTPPSLAQG